MDPSKLLRRKRLARPPLTDDIYIKQKKIKFNVNVYIYIYIYIIYMHIIYIIFAAIKNKDLLTCHPVPRRFGTNVHILHLIPR